MVRLRSDPALGVPDSGDGGEGVKSLARDDEKRGVMEISIAARHCEVTDQLRAAVQEKVTRLSRFLDGMDRAEVRFTEERNPRIADKEICEVTMHGHGHVVRARAAAPDPLMAVDRVVSKLGHRLEKLKGKLVGRSHPRRSGSLGSQAQAVADLARSDGTGDEEEGHPRIVKTKQFEMKPMTPEEAVLHMELLGHDFFLFTNADTGGSAVVYRRKDGHIGLIDGT
jgi:putative sigma-54 modulation protein